MVAILLYIMPVLVAVLVAVYVERVTRMVQRYESAHPQRYVFDGVAVKLEAMIDNGKINENDAQTILETLINELVEHGWDTADEALSDNQDQPFIAQAFDNCGIKLVVE